MVIPAYALRAMSSGRWSKQAQAGVMASVLMSSMVLDPQILHAEVQRARQLAADEVGVLGEEQDALAGSEGDGGLDHRCGRLLLGTSILGHRQGSGSSNCISFSGGA